MLDKDFTSHHRLKALEIAQNMLHSRENGNYHVNMLLAEAQEIYDFIMIDEDKKEV